MKEDLLLLSTILYGLWLANINPYLKKEYDKNAFIIYTGTSEYKTLIFNLRLLSHSFMDFNKTKTSSRTVKGPF